MDSTGCAAGYATDRVFGAQVGAPCGSSMGVFWFVVGLFLALRLMLSYLQIRIATFLMETRKENRAATRVPLTTVCETTHTILNIIMWFLIGFDVVDFNRGLGASLLIITFTPYMFGFYLSSLKLVHLGNKVIPKNVRSQLMSSGSANSDKESASLGLVRADGILQVLFYSMLGSIFLAFFFQVIFATAVFPNQSFWSRIGMGFEAVIIICGGLIVTRQTFRVVGYIEGIHRKQMQVINGGVSGGSDRMLARTMKMLKLRAFTVGFAAAISSTLFILFACGVPIAWFYVLFYAYVGQIGTTGSTIMYKPRSMPWCVSCSPSTLNSTTLSNQNDGINATDSGKLPITKEKQNSSIIVPDLET